MICTHQASSKDDPTKGKIWPSLRQGGPARTHMLQHHRWQSVRRHAKRQDKRSPPGGSHGLNSNRRRRKDASRRAQGNGCGATIADGPTRLSKLTRANDHRRTRQPEILVDNLSCNKKRDQERGRLRMSLRPPPPPPQPGNNNGGTIGRREVIQLPSIRRHRFGMEGLS